MAIGRTNASVSGAIKFPKPTLDDKEWEFIGHTSSARGVVVDSDGYVYTSGYDNTVRKLDSNGNEVWSFTGHTSAVVALAVDSDGYVYSGGLDKSVRKISPDGNEVWKFAGHTSIVRTVIVDSDGYVYSGGNDNTVRKISPDGNEVWSFTGHTNVVWCLAVDSDGHVYSGSSDNTVRKISPDGNEVWSFTGHTSYVYALALCDDYIYTGANDKLVKKLDLNGNEVWSFTGHTAGVKVLCVDPNGYVYSVGSYGLIIQCDFDGNEFSRLDVGESVYGMCVDLYGSLYFTKGNSIIKLSFPLGSLYLITDKKNPKVVSSVLSENTIIPKTTDQIIPSGAYLTGKQTIKGDENLIPSNIIRDKEIFSVRGTADVVEFADPAENSLEWEYTGHAGPVRDVTVDAVGNTYSAGGYGDNSVRKINPDGALMWTYTGHTDWVNAVAVDSEGNVFSGSDDNTLKKINSSGTLVWSYTCQGAVNAIAVDLDGNVYVGAGVTVEKINSSGNRVWIYDDSLGIVNSLVLDSLGNIYFGNQDLNKLNPDGTLAWTHEYDSSIHGLAIDENGNFYIGGTDKTVKKLSPDRAVLWTFTGHTHYILDLVIDPLGNVYTGSQDKTVKKISPDGEQIWSYSLTGIVNGIAIDKDGCIHVGTQNNKVVKIFQRIAVVGTYYPLPAEGEIPTPIPLWKDPTEEVVYMIQTRSGEQVYAQLANEQQVKLTATANDIRLGNTAVTENGVIEGTKDIPSYYSRYGSELVLANNQATIKVPEYEYTSLMVTIASYNTSIMESFSVKFVSVGNGMYEAKTTTKLADITVDLENEQIVLGITPTEKSVIRYFVMKEEV